MSRVVPRFGGASAEQGRPTGYTGAFARAVSGKGGDYRRYRLVAVGVVKWNLAGERGREWVEGIEIFSHF